MRAAWIEAHQASPELTRRQLSRKIPAVYYWLYRHDREWLAVQPPVGKAPISKPHLNWPAIDAATAETLREEAARLSTQVPPQQITRLGLERALGQCGWLEKRLHKLPQCASVLAQLTEPVEDFQCRRVAWAAEELLMQVLPVQVWRLRRLAGLPDQCTAKVERLLIQTAEQIQPASDNHSASAILPAVQIQGCRTGS